MSIKSCIITPTWNNEDYTIRCFDSIQKNTNDYKIIWIDNGSKKESNEKVKKFLDENNVPYELILNKENLGFVKATNQGMKRAMELGADYIVLQNNDTEVYDGWLDGMIDVAESKKNIGIVGPIASPSHGWQDINNLRKSRVDDFGDLPEYDSNHKIYARQIKNTYKGIAVEVYPNVAFFCTLIRRDVVNKIGFLSEDFGIGFGDDDDYCSRALDAGFKIYISKGVFIFHNHRTTFKSQFSEGEIKRMGEKNIEILKKKHWRYRELLGNDKSKTWKDFFHRVVYILKTNGATAAANYSYRCARYKILHQKKSFIK